MIPCAQFVTASLVSIEYNIRLQHLSATNTVADQKHVTLTNGIVSVKFIRDSVYRESLILPNSVIHGVLAIQQNCIEPGTRSLVGLSNCPSGGNGTMMGGKRPRPPRGDVFQGRSVSQSRGESL